MADKETTKTIDKQSTTTDDANSKHRLVERRQLRNEQKVGKAASWIYRFLKSGLCHNSSM